MHMCPREHGFELCNALMRLPDTREGFLGLANITQYKFIIYCFHGRESKWD